jgi:hypothetical protein
VNYAGVGGRHSLRRRRPGRVYLSLRLYGHPDGALDDEYRVDDQVLYLDVPHKTPLDALAGLAYEVGAAVLLGRPEAPEGGVVVRA